MTKSDDFFDITGATNATEAPSPAPIDAPGGVDFDVFGNAEPPNDTVDVTSEFTETLVVRKPSMPPKPVAAEPVDFDLDDDPDDLPVAKPAPAPALEPVAAPAAKGGGKWWIALGVGIVIAVAAWLLLG